MTVDQIVDKIRHIYKFLKDIQNKDLFNRDIIVKLLTYLVNKYNRILKNYKQIKDPYIVNYFKKYLENEFNSIDSIFNYDQLLFVFKILADQPNEFYIRLKDVYKLNNEIILNQLQQSNDNYKIIINIIDYYSTMYRKFGLVMDIYTLTRMFRDFRAIPYQNSLSPKYNIITVGDNHAKRYIQILQDLGFNILFRNTSNNGCFDNVQNVITNINKIFK
jgi:hypothetical protein